MPTMSETCYPCHKPPVIFYGFLVVERLAPQKETAKYSRNLDQQKIAGIARLTLCADCLIGGAQHNISSKTRAHGKPKLFQNKVVEDARQLLASLSNGVFKNSLAMKAAFSGLIGRCESSTQIGACFSDLSIDLMAERAVIPTCFALWTPDSSAPFTRPVNSTFENGGQLKLFHMDSLEKLPGKKLTEDIQNVLPILRVHYDAVADL